MEQSCFRHLYELLITIFSCILRLNTDQLDTPIMSPAEKKKKAARQSVRQPSRQSGQSKRPGVRKSPPQPVIVRTTESTMNGIRSFEASRYVIGYVVSGCKHIYSGDMCHRVDPGDLFFLNKGTHYIEDVPDGRKSFEQVMFFYTSEQLGRIIAGLSVDYGTETVVRHICDDCKAKEFVIERGWDAVKHLLTPVRQHLKDGYFTANHTAEMLSLTMLIYYIISHTEGCLRTRVLGSSDPEKELMERQLHDYVFSNISLVEFAQNNNRGLSSFKKKFKEYFNEPPHRWVMRQRLMHARLLVISTDKSSSQIGIECCMPNTSHFIKLFRNEFGMTPVEYRRKHSAVEEDKVKNVKRTASEKNK